MSSTKDAPKSTSSVPGAGGKPGGQDAKQDGKKGAEAKSAPPQASDAKPNAEKTAAATGAAKSTPPPPRAQKSGGGIGAFFSYLVAGVVGGFLALLGADSLSPQLAQLKSNLGLPAVEDRTAPQFDKLETRLAALEQAESEAGGAAEGQVELAKQVAAAEAKLAELDALKAEVTSLQGGAGSPRREDGQAGGSILV